MTDTALPNVFYPITSPHLFVGSGLPPYETPESSLGYFDIVILPVSDIIDSNIDINKINA
jgi:hypothetical protein